ncbi:hypothetical protein ADEAN_000569300 [Angomonas deanei]|uniref:ZNF598/HEL2 PAH domain-containing protein n=1 Tax=Angomonas deanei TaxID=59799 RepID=A0A7G2CEL3_9TRYP|nr:hypothetical protein ADEAN_000569300 [Angomonas deanei]
MQQDHFTCDICNMGQFTFTFYQNREKLFDHFVRRHKLCDHPDCAKVDPMLRVFKHDLDLGLHKQKVHGIKLKSLEFTDLGGLTESEVNNYNLYGSLPVGGNHHNNGNSNVPATAANMNVIYIIFDFIYRTEKVEMLPTQSNQNNKSKNKNKNHKNNKNNNNNKTEGGKEEASVALVPKSNGLPPHYFEEVHFPIMKRKTTKDENNENEKSENEDSMKRNSSAFRIAENYQTYQRNNNIPTDVEEQKSQLQQLLRKNIPNPSQLNEFKMRTKDFMDGKLLTVHYYEMLSQHFFKHNRPALESVYPLLVATVPDEQKKTALREVWKMKCAPEYQRQEKVKEEERVKQEEAALWESLKAGNNNNNNNSKNNKKGNNNNNGNNPWAKRTKITIVKNAWQDEKNKEKEKPEPPTTSITQRWGTGVNTNHNNNSYQDPFPSFADEAAREELFPSLPSTRPNNNNNKLKPGGKKNKPNAWFKK